MIGGSRMDVAVNGGTVILGESPLSEVDSDGCMVSLPITLDESCSDLEIRVWVDDKSDISISLIEIVPLPSSESIINNIIDNDTEAGNMNVVIGKMREDENGLEEVVELPVKIEFADDVIVHHLGTSSKNKKKQRKSERK